MKLLLFISFVLALIIILSGINTLFSKGNSNKTKCSQFECGFSSFREMSRNAFKISYYIFALLFLLFDLEILLIFPLVVSLYNNSGYGITIVFIYFIGVLLGFVYELGKKALALATRQTTLKPHGYTSLSV